MAQLFSLKCAVLSGLQGSVLGSVLSNLFIEGLSLHVHNCHVVLFVDDCKIFKCFSKSNIGFGIVQDDLNGISDFCQKMQVEISVSKCPF